MRWTDAQDRYLLDHCNQGAESVRKGIHREFGVLRSVEATERHGLRIGASFVKYETCPECGSTVRKLLSDGLCESCHWTALAMRKRKLREALERADAEEAKRLYALEQKAARRAYMKKVDMSAETSAGKESK